MRSWHNPDGDDHPDEDVADLLLSHPRGGLPSRRQERGETVAEETNENFCTEEETSALHPEGLPLRPVPGTGAVRSWHNLDEDDLPDGEDLYSGHASWGPPPAVWYQRQMQRMRALATEATDESPSTAEANTALNSDGLPLRPGRRACILYHMHGCCPNGTGCGGTTRHGALR